jgi:hypothetical protein
VHVSVDVAGFFTAEAYSCRDTRGAGPEDIQTPSLQMI